MCNKNLEPLVTKSNALARAQWHPESILEPRLVAIIASKVSREDKEFKAYQIHVSELFGSHYGAADIRELRKVVDNLMGRVITIFDDNGWSKYNLFAKCKYSERNKTLEVCFHSDLLPHYLQLKRFVQYRLADFMKLPCTASQRMYEFLKSWSSQPYVTVTVTELRQMIGAKDYLKSFSQFRIRVLEKAKRDLEVLDFHFEWDLIKNGRKVEKIRFRFPITPQERLKAWKRRDVIPKCRAEHGDACVGGHQDPAVCDFCLRTWKAGE